MTDDATEQDTTKRLTKAFTDAIPQGPHPTPYSEWISVRLDFIQEAIDHMEWIEKGLEEWREMYVREAKLAARLEAQDRVAIRYLDKVLNGCRTHCEQQQYDAEARDWLLSIGGI